MRIFVFFLIRFYVDLPTGLHFNLETKIVELYIESVFSGRYPSVFLGIYHTDTKENLGRYISVSYFWRGTSLSLKKGALAPFLSKKGGSGPPFDTASPSYAEEKSSRQISNTNRKYQPSSKSDTGKT
jgi:hypothetical protein